jgi:hypothetical protein
VRGRSAGVRLALALIGLATVGLATWGALSWTLVPGGLDAQVVETSWSEGGPPWKEVHTEDGALTVHTDLYEDMGGEHGLPGQHLEKDPWDRTVVVGGRPVPLAVPWTSWKTVLLVAGLVVVALVRTGRRLGLASGADEVEASGADERAG